METANKVQMLLRLVYLNTLNEDSLQDIGVTTNATCIECDVVGWSKDHFSIVFGRRVNNKIIRDILL